MKQIKQMFFGRYELGINCEGIIPFPEVATVGALHKYVVLNNFAKFIKTPYEVSFKKVAGWKRTTLFKRRLRCSFFLKSFTFNSTCLKERVNRTVSTFLKRA